MSIYATLWKLKFPIEGDHYEQRDWIEVTAQAVPPHVGTPAPGLGYEGGDPYSGFLPPAVETEADGDAPVMRAVVFVTEYTIKGTERNGQEYIDPLLVITGQEYARVTFAELYARLCDALGAIEKDVGSSQAQILAGPAQPPPKVEPRRPYTPKQGQYLAFISHFSKIHGQPPSEAEMQQYFKVRPPTVHQMVLRLESNGLIARTPGKARSIRLLVDRSDLPDLE